MRTSASAITALTLGGLLAGCAATTTTSKVAVDYNRAFAKSRNEVLVTNILRAAAREPLQFSAMGTVTGGVRNSGSLKLPFAGLIAGGDFGISPEITVNEGINPNVNIVPLDDKLFTEAILKPISLETVGYFLNQGWDPELILPLVVGGIVCPDKIVLNRGSEGDHYVGFARMFSEVPRVPIRAKQAMPVATVRMTGKDAAAFLKDGVGSGRKIDKVRPAKADQVDVEIVTEPGYEFVGLNTGYVCEESAKRPKAAGTGAAAVDEAIGKLIGSVPESASFVTVKGEGAKVMMRSVESIIYFLGETHRSRWPDAARCATSEPTSRWPYYWRFRPPLKPGEKRIPEVLTLFHAERACGSDAVPLHTFVQTRFNDRSYYIKRAEAVSSTDRTLTTLSFLSALIALQTNPSTIASATPVIAISAQ